MEIINKILALFKNEWSKEAKLIIEQWKVLYEETKAKVKVHEERIKELEELKLHNLTVEEGREMIEREKKYHQELIKLIQTERDLKEEIIFLKIELKNKKN